MLKTETPNTEHGQLDQYPTAQLVETLVDDQLVAIKAVRAASPQIAAAVDAAVPRMQEGGRLIYVGAGTSGRLGVLDSVELYPTFSMATRARRRAAGGWHRRHVRRRRRRRGRPGTRQRRPARAGADRQRRGAAAGRLRPHTLCAGRPAHRARTGRADDWLCQQHRLPVAGEAHIGVTLDTGTEIISGSTRLKAGTSQKIALNTFSSSLMVRLHKVYGNLMVDLKPTNAKLVVRAVRLTMIATGAPEDQARAVLEECGFHVKVAVVALKRQTSVVHARALLEQAHGSVRQALAA